MLDAKDATHLRKRPQFTFALVSSQFRSLEVRAGLLHRKIDLFADLILARYEQAEGCVIIGFERSTLKVE
jgi:hypothetical protein